MLNNQIQDVPPSIPDSETATSLPMPDLLKIGKANVVGVLIGIMLVAANTREETVSIEAKEISANANAQNELNKRNGDINFSIVPGHTPNGKDPVGQATIDRIMTENQHYAAIRSNIQNSLVLTQQNAHVLMTKASTNINLLQQNGSQISGLLSMIRIIAQLINDMTGQN